MFIKLFLLFCLTLYIYLLNEYFRGNLRRAVELFDKAIPLSKTELELSHIYSLRDAAKAQQIVADKLKIPGLIDT